MITLQVEILGLASPARYELSEIVAGLEHHKKIWRNLGFEPNLYPSCYQQDYYQTIHPKLKADELKKAMLTNNPIVALRGGYSTNFILDYLDWDELIPSVIVGHSDLTILLNHLAYKSNWEVWHGPLFTSVSLGDNQTLKLLKSCLVGEINELSSFSKFDIYRSGCVEGTIIGGNLSLITGVIGTKYELDITNKILLIEEVNEPDYKIDAMLFQLTRHYDFSQVKGIIFGSMVGCNYEKTSKHRGIKEIINDYFKGFKGPIIMNFSSSHALPMTPLPLNRQVIFDTSKPAVVICSK